MLATGLSTGRFKGENRLPVVLADAYNIPSLLALTPSTALAQYAGLRTNGQIVTLESLQHSNAAGVSLFVTADGYSSAPLDAAASALFTPTDPTQGPIFHNEAVSKLEIDIANTNQAPVSNFWSAWTVGLRKPTLLDRLFNHGLSPLTSAEMELLLANGIDPSRGLPSGIYPRSLKWIIDNEYRNHLRNAVPLSKSSALPGGSAVLMFSDTPRSSDDLMVVTALAVSPGSGSDGLAAIVGVDNNESYLTLPAYPIGTGKPLPLFIQATTRLDFYLTSASAVAAASLAVVVWHVDKTDEIRVRLGEITEGPVFDAVTVGRV